MCIRDRHEGLVVSEPELAHIFEVDLFITCIEVGHPVSEGISNTFGAPGYDVFTKARLAIGNVELCRRRAHHLDVHLPAGRSIYVLPQHSKICLAPVSYTHLDVYKRQEYALFDNSMSETTLQRELAAGVAYVFDVLGEIVGYALVRDEMCIRDSQ